MAFKQVLVDSHVITRRKLAAGWGVNDAPYMTQPTFNGKVVKCPYYAVWFRVIYAVHGRNGRGQVCEQWRSFMAFREWMKAQDWQRPKLLDITLLGKDSGVFSPGTCVFVPYKVANLRRSLTRSDSKLPVGVDSHGEGYYRATCQGKFLGHFKSVSKARLRWRIARAASIIELAAEETDERVQHALLEIAKELNSCV